MLVTMRRVAIIQVATGADMVFAGFPMPPGSKLVQVRGKVSVAPSARLAIEEFVAYGCSGFVVPVLDPDAASSQQTIWDVIVPKDDAVGSDVLDLDTSSADSSPEFAVGSVDLNAVLGIEDGYQEIYRRRQFMSYGSHPMAHHLDTTHFYWPAEQFNIKVSQPIGTDRFAMALFGFSSPTLGESTTEPTAPSKAEWGMMMFLDSTLEDMSKQILGLTEAGAETPYDTAATFLAKLLEPIILEQAARATDSIGIIWDVNAVMMAQVHMPGSQSFSNLSSE